MYTAPGKIKELRDAGWKVKVQVWRMMKGESRKLYSRKDGITGHNFSARGGQTAIALIPPGDMDGGFVGVSFCHPDKDNFNKKIGLEIALGRALKKAGFQEPGLTS